MLSTRRGPNSQPPDHQSDAHPTEPQGPANQLVREDNAHIVPEYCSYFSIEKKKKKQQQKKKTPPPQKKEKKKKKKKKTCIVGIQ